MTTDERLQRIEELLATLVDRHTIREAYGIPEAAKLLGLSRATVYNLMDKGDLPYVKLGRSRRIRRTDLEEALERHKYG